MSRAAVRFLRLSTLVGLLLPALAAAEPSHRVGPGLDQSSAGLPFNSALAAAVRLTLNAAGTPPISFYSEHLDANRFFGSEYEDNFVQFLKVNIMKGRSMSWWPSGYRAVISLHAGVSRSGHRYP